MLDDNNQASLENSYSLKILSGRGSGTLCLYFMFSWLCYPLWINWIVNKRAGSRECNSSLIRHSYLSTFGSNDCWLFNQANREKAIENWLCKPHNRSSLTNLMSTLNDHSFQNKNSPNIKNNWIFDVVNWKSVYISHRYQLSGKYTSQMVYSKLFALFLELTLIVFFVVQKNFHCLLLSVERKKVYMRTIK